MPPICAVLKMPMSAVVSEAIWMALKLPICEDVRALICAKLITLIWVLPRLLMEAVDMAAI